ncbi:MAG: hypothetical protein JXR13_06820 [Thalassovita sp.]
MLRTTLIACVLILMPIASFAMCSEGHQQAMSCIDGMVWDAETQSCIKQVSS